MSTTGKKGQNTKMTAKERHHLKAFIKELEGYKGRGTELVSVYIPAGYDINKILTHLAQEQGTATNIKSKQTRDNVISALERMIQHLKLFSKTPENGLAVFSGNVAEREGQQDYQVWSYEPQVPVNIRIYRCEKEFILDPLRDMIEDKYVYGLVVMDRRDAALALLKGKTIIPLAKTHSEVAGKTRAGGQCLVNSTMVQIADGDLVSIEKLHNPFWVKSANLKSKKIEDSPIVDKWSTKKRVYKVVTKFPRLEVESSPDHVFFVATDSGVTEKKAKDLTTDDLLVMPEKIEVTGRSQRLDSLQYYNSFIISEKGRGLLKRKRVSLGMLQRDVARKAKLTQTYISTLELGKRNSSRDYLERVCKVLMLDFDEFLKKYTKPYLYKEVRLPTRLDEVFAQFLGYCAGDGSVEKDRITFFEQEKEVALQYQKEYERYFSTSSSYRFRASKNYHQIRFTSRPLVRLLQSFPGKARNTEIPAKILVSSSKVVAGFLRGFFDAEGYARDERVGLGINNKRLAQQIQMALLRFSIISSLYEYDNRRNPYSDNHRFTIDISEKQSLQLFKKHIGFTSTRKIDTLSLCIKEKSHNSQVRQILASGKRVRRIIERAGYNVGMFPKVTNFFRNERMMGKATFRSSILKYVKDKKLYTELKELYQQTLLPVQIQSITRGGEVPMTDISVKNQNFIANGLLVHNSAPRFQRLREGATKDHYKKVADYMKENFLFREGLKGIIIGGPSTTTNDFMNKDYVTGDVKKKIIGIKDLSYTGDFGLQELLDKSSDVLSDEEVAHEKEVMKKFFEKLAKHSDLVTYGLEETQKALSMGAVDVLLLSEELDDSVLDELEKKADESGTTVEIISVDTREGVQLRDIGKIASILRFQIG